MSIDNAHHKWCSAKEFSDERSKIIKLKILGNLIVNGVPRSSNIFAHFCGKNFSHFLRECPVKDASHSNISGHSDILKDSSSWEVRFDLNSVPSFSTVKYYSPIYSL